MNWLDEGTLYSSIGLFLREDLGRGDITTQTVLMRNARAAITPPSLDATIASTAAAIGWPRGSSQRGAKAIRRSIARAIPRRRKSAAS